MEYITTVYNPSLFAFLRNVVICFFVNGAVLLEGCFAGLAAGTWKEKMGNIRWSFTETERVRMCRYRH